MSKQTKAHIMHVSPTACRKPRGLSFVQLAKKHITKLGTEEAKTISRDVDNILYGRTSTHR